MVFKATKDNGGVRDSRINKLGRITREKPLNKELKDRYMLEALRKVRPVQALAIKRYAEILGDDKALHQSWLKAGAYISDTYIKLVKDLYGTDEVDDDEDSVDAIQENKPQQPKFSLVMLPSAVPKEDTKE